MWTEVHKKVTSTMGGVRTYPDDLPEQTKHQVRLAGVEVVGADVDDVAADGARRVQGQCQVLVDLVDAQLAALVDGALVDRVVT